ncbi:MAG: SAM-dependent methyltransferase, partial [Bacteroidales bacterium]|nr:SAM-dependent methyltransferase [Bacteroidales bacterium]
MSKGSLYLIPNKISDAELENVVPPQLAKIVPTIKHYIVEDVRTVRRYLRLLSKEVDIDSTQFYELNKHTLEGEISSYLSAAEQGENMGLISEAGLPCVADPGNVIVAMAHKKGIRVVPLVGPCSMMMALMASGLNGQNFAFNGYIPIEQHERAKKIRDLELRSRKEQQSQIFMDTPYRNNRLFDDLKSILSPQTLLCVASNITS